MAKFSAVIISIVAIVITLILAGALYGTGKTQIQNFNNSVNAGITAASSTYSTLTETLITLYPVLYPLAIFIIVLIEILAIVGIKFAMGSRN